MLNTAVDKAGAVAIARDVLAQLDAVDGPRYSTSNGYLRTSRFNVDDLGNAAVRDSTTTASIDLQKALPLIEGKCTVCMMGGLLLAKARLFNDEIIAIDIDASGNGSMSLDRPLTAQALQQYFSDDTLDVIEAAFEGHTHNHDDDTLEKLCNGATWATRGMNATQRAFFVAENIIANNGDFVVQPEDDPVEGDEDDDDEEDDDEDDDEDEEDDDD